MCRVSFDFDDTLSLKDVQEYAKNLPNNIDIWIITSRSHFDWYDVIDVAEKLDISFHRILFTNTRSKRNAISDINPIWHLDDDKDDLNLISNNTIGICVEDDWKDKCNKLLNK